MGIAWCRSVGIDWARRASTITIEMAVGADVIGKPAVPTVSVVIVVTKIHVNDCSFLTVLIVFFHIGYWGAMPLLSYHHIIFTDGHDDTIEKHIISAYLKSPGIQA